MCYALVLWHAKLQNYAGHIIDKITAKSSGTNFYSLQITNANRKQTCTSFNSKSNKRKLQLINNTA